MNQLIGDPTRQPADAERGAAAIHSTGAVDQPAPPKGAGSEPEYFPGEPVTEPPKFQLAARRSRPRVSWLQAH
jgi:hypothetical protein